MEIEHDSCAQLADNETQHPSIPGSPSTSASRAGVLWQKVKEKYHLAEFNAVPDYLQDNEFILAHYRADWPLKQTLLSMFSIHNETLNIWTHLIGFMLFLGLTAYTFVKLPDVVHKHGLPSLPSFPNTSRLQKMPNEMLKAVSSSLPRLRLQEILPKGLPDGLQLHALDMLSKCLPEALVSTNRTDHCVLKMMTDDVANLIAPFPQNSTPRWPFFTFLGGAMFCLLASSTCHLLLCHSRRVAYIMLRIDYAGIAALISTSFYPPVYYSFMCNPLLSHTYLTVISIVGIAAVLVLLIPAFQAPEYRNFRAALFSGMALSGLAPVLHKLILHHTEPEALYTTVYELAMLFFYGLGAVAYTTRIPERWRPGTFDIAGNSHQLLHLLVVAGAYTHYHACLLYLQWRDEKGCYIHS